MSDEFTPQVRTLLDRLEPPALSADFADRVLAQTEAEASLPPLPPLRKPRLRRRIALTVVAAGLVGVAAAAAVVPVDVWRSIPVIGEIVELIAPAKHEPAPAPAPSAPVPAAPVAAEPAIPEPAPPAEPDSPSVTKAVEAPPPVEERAAVPPPAAVAAPEPVERPRETLAQPVRELPMPAPTREAATLVETRPTPAPERVRQADTSETRQQVRERTTTTRETTRERAQQQRERRISRGN